MKFKSELDRELCCQELVCQGLDVGEEVTASTFDQPEVKTFIVKKRSMTKKLKDFRRSQSAKEAWRGNKYKYLKGIRQFAKSVAGKRTRRSITRYVVSRELLKGPQQPSFGDVSSRLRESQPRIVSVVERSDLPDLAVALSSCKTHMLIETRYWMPTLDEAEYLESLEIIFPRLSNLLERAEIALINYQDLELEEDDMYLISALAGDSDTDSEVDGSITLDDESLGN